MIIGVFDFETTDKEIKSARITQYALSLYDTDNEWREVYHYSTLCYQDDYPEVSEGAKAITGITTAQLKRFGRPTYQVLQEFISLFPDIDFLCGHNIRSYDVPLLRFEADRYVLSLSTMPDLIDTRFDCPWPEHIETRKLLYLAAEYGVANPMAHSARHDVDLTVYLLKQFDLELVLKRALSKEVWIQAHVVYDTREKAKARKFSWDGDKKIWVKQVKECDLDQEVRLSDFKVSILSGYGTKT